MTLKERWKKFRYYTIPFLINKYIRHQTISQQGYDFLMYCFKVAADPSTEPQTYQEQMFDEKLKDDTYSREQIARECIVYLTPYCEEDKNG